MSYQSVATLNIVWFSSIFSISIRFQTAQGKAQQKEEERYRISKTISEECRNRRSSDKKQKKHLKHNGTKTKPKL